MKFLVTAALLVSAVSALKVDLMNGKNAPSTGQEWVTIGPNGHEAQPGDFSKHPPEMAAKLRATFQRTLEGDGYKGYDMNFADSSVEYPDEQQAWRYLGLFVDCNPEANLDEENGDEEEGRELSGSQDNYDDTCTRYVLYAAYVDPNYEGNGIGEYAFWDRHKQSWDTSACEATGSSCRKMDCHLPGTEFELLGFYKMPSPRDWMDQLFKHEGYCTWFPEEYNFMQGHARTWPRGCTPTYINDLYVDIKPMPGGDWSLGIYTDQICTKEYSGRAMGVIEAYDEANPYEPSHDSGNYEYGGVLSLAQNIQTWNDGIALWKQCHPCRTYNIGNGQYANAADDDAADEDAANDDGGRRYHRRASGDEDGDGYNDPFYCDDDAGYLNVNQCMKFYAKASLRVATFRNMALASGQGSIVEVDLETGETFGSKKTVNAYFSLNSSREPSKFLIGLFYASLAFFVIGAAFFIFAWRTKDKRGGSLEHPLVESKGVVA